MFEDKVAGGGKKVGKKRRKRTKKRCCEDGWEKGRRVSE
jgi:hypothetical protein